MKKACVLFLLTSFLTVGFLVFASASEPPIYPYPPCQHTSTAVRSVVEPWRFYNYENHIREKYDERYCTKCLLPVSRSNLGSQFGSHIKPQCYICCP